MSDPAFVSSVLPSSSRGLECLATEDLLDKRAEIRASIPVIQAQLMDQARRPQAPEDDSPQWDAYREWRRRARWALALEQSKLATIRSLLTHRRDLAEAQRKLRRQQDQPTGDELAQQERGQRLRDTLGEMSDLALLLRAYRVIRHLLVSGEPLPEGLDQDDRDALTMLSVRLRKEYGSKAVDSFAKSPHSS